MLIVLALMLAALAVLLYVSALFVLSLVLRRNDVADVGWGPGVVLPGVIGWLFVGGSGVGAFALILALIWAARLALRIGLRNARKAEDARYAVWRAGWGKWFLARSYVQIYLLQGVLMLCVGYPVLHTVVFGHEPMGLLPYIGALVWFVGFACEGIADYQLDVFLRTPGNKGKLLTTGLWRYSRHPNYFGEVLLWWGIGLMALSLPYGVLALIGPITITFLILKVSGVPMLERGLATHPDFAEYKARTSVFIPLPPRNPRTQLTKYDV